MLPLPSQLTRTVRVLALPLTPEAWGVAAVQEGKDSWLFRSLIWNTPVDSPVPGVWRLSYPRSLAGVSGWQISLRSVLLLYIVVLNTNSQGLERTCRYTQ